MRPVQDFEFENDTWWNQSNVEEYHRNMTKVVQYGQTSISIHPHTQVCKFFIMICEQRQTNLRAGSHCRVQSRAR